MIIQSTNKPIIIKANEDLSVFSIRATLWRMSAKVKEWEKEDMVFEDNYIQLPLTQEETANFKSGEHILEIKWLNADGKVDFAKKIALYVMNRNDKEVITDGKM